MFDRVLKARGYEAALYLVGFIAAFLVLLYIPAGTIAFLLTGSVAISSILYFNHVWGHDLVSLIQGGDRGDKKPDTPSTGDQQE